MAVTNEDQDVTDIAKVVAFYESGVEDDRDAGWEAEEYIVGCRADLGSMKNDSSLRPISPAVGDHVLVADDPAMPGIGTWLSPVTTEEHFITVAEDRRDPDRVPEMADSSAPVPTS